MEPCESNVVPACSVTSDSLWPYGLEPTRPLCPWDSPGKSTGVGCHALLQGIYPTQGSNWHLLGFLHWQMESWPLCHLGSQVSQAMRIQFCYYWISHIIHLQSFACPLLWGVTGFSRYMLITLVMKSVWGTSTGTKMMAMAVVAYFHFTSKTCTFQNSCGSNEGRTISDANNW